LAMGPKIDSLLRREAASGGSFQFTDTIRLLRRSLASPRVTEDEELRRLRAILVVARIKDQRNVPLLQTIATGASQARETILAREALKRMGRVSGEVNNSTRRPLQ
jgi:hypothetical protein